MPTVFDFETNVEAQPVKYVQVGGGGWDGPSPPGSWESVGQPVPVIRVPIRSEEKVRAGIDVNTEAGKLIFNGNPITTSMTLDIDGKRYNVRTVAFYNVSEFPEVSVAEIVRL